MITHSQKEILCTLGPSSINERVIARLEDMGVNLFRVNLSHTQIEELAEIIQFIQKRTSVPICLDTEGAQIRTGSLLDGKVVVQEQSTVRIVNQLIVGNADQFNLYPQNIVGQIYIGDIINIDFNSVLVQVISKDESGLVVRVITGGTIGQNKAVSVDREIDIPPLTAKDRQALELGMKMGINYVALSFANSREDVEELRSIVGEKRFVISKIESLSGIKHLEEIAERSNAILIDRGDLAREFPIEQIPQLQKEIIKCAKQFDVKIYVATNLLESMCTAPKPNRSEVNDIFNTLDDGVDGLVLAAETAIGAYPIQCTMMVSKIIQQYIEYSSGSPFSVERLRNKNPFLLVDPHGGILVNRIMTDYDIDQIKTYKKVMVNEMDLLNAEQIAIGAFSPLEGFMTKEELNAVLNNYSLPNGVVWPLPIVLQTTKEQMKDLKLGQKVALCLNNCDEIYAVIYIEDIYTYDLDEMAKKVFSTNDEIHPGVRMLKQNGEIFIGGKINLLKRLPSPFKHYEITPRQARAIFENKGWIRVVGFHTRNVVHRIHEHIQLLAFEKYHCDGIFVHPLIGPKKKGDYSSEIILKSYELMVDRYYPNQKALIAAFQSYPRYSGPREAVFTALCRKNFGCSHFIVGRDHSGVGGFYKPDEAHQLFESLGNIEIQPVFFNEVYYCTNCNQYTEGCENGKENILKISGTRGREMLRKHKIPPVWFMREDISRLIINEIDQGKEVFVE